VNSPATFTGDPLIDYSIVFVGVFLVAIVYGYFFGDGPWSRKNRRK